MIKNNEKLTFLLLWKKNEKGVASVEFAGVLIGFFLLTLLACDHGLFLARIGHLERITHSLAIIFRERAVFYNVNDDVEQSELITQAQVDELTLLADRLVENSHAGKISLRVDFLKLEGKTKNNSSISSSSMTLYSAGRKRCSENLTLGQLTPLSPFAPGRKRWVPIYRITACIDGDTSLFRRLTGEGNKETPIVARSAVIARTDFQSKN